MGSQQQKALNLALSSPELLTDRHDASAFSCGKPALDIWLKTHALSNQVRGFTVVMVVHDDGQVVGYYGLAPTTVVRSSLPRAIRTGQSPDPVPCLLLGQLAVDHRWNGRGIGSGLLRHALARAVSGATLVGGRACWSKPSTPTPRISGSADVSWRRATIASRFSDRLPISRHRSPHQSDRPIRKPGLGLPSSP